MPDPKLSISLTEKDFENNNQDLSQGFNYYSQGSNVQGTDSKNLNDTSIFLTQEDVDNIKGQNQGFIDKSINNTGAALVKTMGTMVGAVGYTYGALNGVTQAIARGFTDTGFDTKNIDFKVDDFTDNSLIHFEESVNTWVDKSLPNYLTQDEKDNAMSLKNMVGSIFNTTMRDAVPFFATFMLEGIALGKLVANASKVSALRRLEALGGEAISKLPEGVRGTMRKFMQDLPQDAVREFMIAQESLIEAHHGSEEVYKENYQAFKDAGLSDESAHEKASNLEEQAYKNLFFMNEGILRLGNIEMKAAFKPKMSSRRPFNELGKEWSTLKTTGAKAEWLASKVGSLATSEPVKEAAEEVLQGSTNQSVKDKIAKDKEAYGVMDSAIFGIDTLFGAIDRLSTAEGQLEAISSILLSGPTTIHSNIQNKKAEEQRRVINDTKLEHTAEDGLTEEIKDATGKTVNKLTTKGEELRQRAKTYSDFENLKNAAIATGNTSLYNVAQNTQMANVAYSHFEAGLGEQLDKKYDDILKQTREESFGLRNLRSDPAGTGQDG